MFLKSLTISNGESIIRKINFHKGVNLIVDKTTSTHKTGNNVGKTTILRLIYFCLGGDGENIYQDPEFKDKKSSKIESFLKDKNILITLVLTSDLENKNAEEITIEKNFLNRPNKILKINNKTITKKDFDKTLKQQLLNFNFKKPTLKQIIAKNIRDEQNRLLHTVKVLSNYASDVEYEELYLFWLGESSDTNKRQLIFDQKVLKKIISNIESDADLSQIEQSLCLIESQIKKLNAQKSMYKLNVNHDEEDLKKLNIVNSKLDKLCMQFSQLSTRQDLILESKKDLEKDIATIDTKRVEYLYNKANTLIPDVQKKFQEVLEFHNQMTRNKIEYITKELPQLNLDIKNIESKIKELSESKEQLSKKIYNKNVITDLSKIELELNQKHEDKGQWTEKQKTLKKAKKELEQITDKLKIINIEIESKNVDIQKKMKIFNQYFSDISNTLYKKSFVLNCSIKKECYGFNISSLDSNVGTGMKKGQMAAFDLAYIQFADKSKIKCLHFILHDQIETVHGTQILKLITEVVSKINCQYIVPVLEDKLPPDLDKNKYIILSLSQDDKLFKIK